MGGRGSNSGKTTGFMDIPEGTDKGKIFDLGTRLNHSDWESNLTPSEIHAIRDYTGSQYAPINEYLRGGHSFNAQLKPNIISTSDEISKALIKNKLQKNVTVYRGMSYAALNLNGRDFNRISDFQDAVRKFKGATITDKGFMSTSVYKKTAFDSDIRVSIKAPKGTHAAFIQTMGVSAEHEVLFNKGSKMKILDVKIDTTHNKTYIDAILLKK